MYTQTLIIMALLMSSMAFADFRPYGAGMVVPQVTDRTKVYLPNEAELVYENNGSTKLLLINTGTSASPNWFNLTALGTAPTKQILTSGTGATYTKPAGVSWIRVRMWGGGGGGGGTASAASTSGAAAGGAGGGYCEKIIVSPSSTYTYTIGAAGSGGAAGNNNGTAGTATSFDGSTYVANGGAGGVGSSTSVGPSWSTGATTGGTASGCDINIDGGNGEGGLILSSGQAQAGSGGGSGPTPPTGGQNASAAGFTARGYGGGGGGGVQQNNGGTKAGGNGGAGVIIVDEYYQ